MNNYIYNYNGIIVFILNNFNVDIEYKDYSNLLYKFHNYESWVNLKGSEEYYEIINSFLIRSNLFEDVNININNINTFLNLFKYNIN